MALAVDAIAARGVCTSGKALVVSAIAIDCSSLCQDEDNGDDGDGDEVDKDGVKVDEVDEGVLTKGNATKETTTTKVMTTEEFDGLLKEFERGL